MPRPENETKQQRKVGTEGSSSAGQVLSASWFERSRVQMSKKQRARSTGSRRPKHTTLWERVKHSIARANRKFMLLAPCGLLDRHRKAAISLVEDAGRILCAEVSQRISANGQTTYQHQHASACIPVGIADTILSSRSRISRWKRQQCNEFDPEPVRIPHSSSIGNLIVLTLPLPCTPLASGRVVQSTFARGVSPCT